MENSEILKILEKHQRYALELREDYMKMRSTKKQLSLRMSIALPTLEAAADYLHQNLQILTAFYRALPPNGR